MKPAAWRSCCLASLCTLTAMVFSPAAARPDDPDPKLVARFKKKVESAVKKGKGDYFVVVLLTSTYHEGEVERTTSRLVPMNGQLFRDDATTFKSGEYCPEAEFKVIEGGDAVVEAVVEHMTPLLAAPPKKKGKQSAEGPPPPSGDWKLIGRFADSDKADDALAKAQAAFDAEPRWQPAKKR